MKTPHLAIGSLLAVMASTLTGSAASSTSFVSGHVSTSRLSASTAAQGATVTVCQFPDLTGLKAGQSAPLVVLGRTTTDADGNYSVPVAPQLATTVLEFYNSTDSTGDWTDGRTADSSIGVAANVQGKWVSGQGSVKVSNSKTNSVGVNPINGHFGRYAQMYMDYQRGQVLPGGNTVGVTATSGYSNDVSLHWTWKAPGVMCGTNAAPANADIVYTSP